MNSLFKKSLLITVAAFSLANTACAQKLTLTSTDIAEGEYMGKAQEFAGFGCDGENLSPQLSWSGAPEGTKAFAVFAYDPDAPTGSGWWHWQVVNIPVEVSELVTGAGDLAKGLLPEGSLSVSNDYGVADFGGACPPNGHGVHRYQFTLFALPAMLKLPENPSSALVGYFVNQNALESTTIEALYQRD